MAKGKSAWKCMWQHCAQAVWGRPIPSNGNVSSFGLSAFQGKVNGNALALAAFPLPPVRHNLASGRPPHTGQQPFPWTLFITRRSHWRQTAFSSRSTCIFTRTRRGLHLENQWPSTEDRDFLHRRPEQNEATSQWRYLACSKRKIKTFVHGMVSLSLNFLLNFSELLVNFYWTYFWIYLHELLWILKCLWIVLVVCFDYCNVLIVLFITMYCIDFAMKFFDWFTDWLNDLKDLINFIDLYCIVILLH